MDYKAIEVRSLDAFLGSMTFTDNYTGKYLEEVRNTFNLQTVEEFVIKLSQLDFYEYQARKMFEVPYGPISPKQRHVAKELSYWSVYGNIGVTQFAPRPTFSSVVTPLGGAIKVDWEMEKEVARNLKEVANAIKRPIIISTQKATED